MTARSRTHLVTVVIPADSTLPARVEDVAVDLAWLQGQVGGYIEAVMVQRILTDEGMRTTNCTVFVNEEGKLTGLPVNARATDLCAVTIGGWFNDVIAGDVVVVGPPDNRGDETSCPQEVVDIVTEWGWCR
jgi:hypothetical protein